MNFSTSYSYFIRYKDFNIEKRESNNEGQGAAKEKLAMQGAIWWSLSNY
jgi:hypothetical protein